MEIAILVISAGITIFAVTLLMVSAFSYKKYRNIKLFFMTIVFLLFFIRGVMLSLSLFYEQISVISFLTYLWLFDLIILILLYVTSLKR